MSWLLCSVSHWVSRLVVAISAAVMLWHEAVCRCWCKLLFSPNLLSVITLHFSVLSKGHEHSIVSHKREIYTSELLLHVLQWNKMTVSCTEMSSFMINKETFFVFLSLPAVLYVLTQVRCLRVCVRTSPGHKVTASSDLPTAVKTSLFTSQSEWR